MQTWIDRLISEHSLPPEIYRMLLNTSDADTLAYLHRMAHFTTLSNFGNRIFIRGLIEVSSYCRNNCLYCGIRSGNSRAERYRLDKDTILQCCHTGYELGFRTFVMQGGEDPQQTPVWWKEVVSEIRRTYPDCAITLSLGEMNREDYQMLYQAGANRYLLRHETYNSEHYQMLHPEKMSQAHRLQCLDWLKETGFQTGTGFMVGSPGQTSDNLVEDLLYIERFKPEMIGIGPFLPHRDTPFANRQPGNEDLTLRLISILRLMHPHALIPSTTALASLSPDGRLKGIQAGANVMMPNLSPVTQRSKYSLYNNKATLGAEAAEGLALLEKQLESIGYTLSYERGDFQGETK